MRKLGVILGFSVLWGLVSIARVSDRPVKAAEIGIDTSWMVALPATLRDGYISGRDFHFMYGPGAQILAFAGAWFHNPWDPLDSVALIMLAFYTSTIVLLAIVLWLIPEIDWKRASFIYVAAAFLNLFSEPTSFRALALLLCVTLVYRAVRSSEKAWALAAGASCVAAQLVTVELGVYSIATAIGAFGALAMADRKRRSIYLRSLMLVVAGFAGANLIASAVLGFGYQRYALEMMRGYNYTAGAVWELNAGPTAGLFVACAMTIALGTFVMRRWQSEFLALLAPFTLCSVLSVKSALIRSDLGHITQALSPLVFTFLLIGAVLVTRLHRIATAWAIAFVILSLSWPWAGPYAAYDAVRGAANSPLQKLNRLRTVSSGRGELLPPGLADAVRNDAAVMTFPHENHIAVELGRPLLTPVLQSFNASTEDLQRYYVQRLQAERAHVDVVYGLDNAGSMMMDSVQAITRVPIIFEYLRSNFRLATNSRYGTGFYLLRAGDSPRRWQSKDVVLQKAQPASNIVEIRPNAPLACNIVRIDLRMDYPVTQALGRPVPLDMVVFRDSVQVQRTGVVAIKPNEQFSTYVSLMPPDQFHTIFGDEPAPPASWDSIRLEPRATDLAGVLPSFVDVSRIACITFSYNSAAP